MSSKDELYRGYPYSMLKLRVVIALHELKGAVETWLRAMTTDWLLMPIQRHYQFNPGTEGSISKFLFEIACSASSSTNVDALKFRLVQYDKFYSGEQQMDASECLKMLMKLINKGSVPYCGYNDNSSIWNFIFTYVRKIYCLLCMWTEIPLHLSLVPCYILHLLVPLPCRNW